MKRLVRNLALVAFIACTGLAPAAAATLVVDTDGTLTGAKGTLMGLMAAGLGLLALVRRRSGTARP